MSSDKDIVPPQGEEPEENEAVEPNESDDPADGMTPDNQDETENETGQKPGLDSDTSTASEENGESSSDAEDSAAEEDDEDDGGSNMGLLEHLGELRTRLVRAVLAAAVGMIACYAFAEQMFDILMKPMKEVLEKQAASRMPFPKDFFQDLQAALGQVLKNTDFRYHDQLGVFMSALEKSLGPLSMSGHFQYTYPAEAFFAHIKISIVAGIFLMSPFIFAQIWGFIAPGLYSHERRWVVPMALISAIFFVGGGVFGYKVVFPFGFDFFASFASSEIAFTPKLNEYLSFCLKLLFAFGLVFELPLFIFFLARLGLVTSKGLRKKRKYAILISFVASAILTPPDPFTQCLMAGPLIILYELGVWVAFFFGKKKPKPEIEDETDEDEGEKPTDSQDDQA